MPAPVGFKEPILFPPPSLLYDKLPKPVKQTLDRMKQITVDLFGQMQNTVIKTDVPPAIQKIYEMSTQTERVFNILGCIPFLGRLSGSVRYLGGKSQILLGLALVGLSEVSLFFIKVSSQRDDKIIEKKWKMLAHLGAEITFQGSLNTLRGLAEVLVGEYTFGLGNVIFIAVNLKNERNFNPHFPYGTFAALVQKQEEEAAATAAAFAAAQAEQKDSLQDDGGLLWPHPFQEHEERKRV
jgi:hypothetical protein